MIARTSTGTYTVTFNTPQANNTYTVLLSVETYDANFTARVIQNTKTINGFQIRSGSPTPNGTLGADVNAISILVINY